MFAHRAKFLGATILAAGAASLLLAGGPAQAQMDQNTAVNILRECARIDDPSARLACYDNNIRNVGGTARVAVPGQMPVVQGGRAPVVQGGGAPLAADSPSGFGADDVRPQERYASQVRQVDGQVTAIRPREPGIYAFTLEGGAEWLFAESVAQGYRVPRAGSTVEIERGALGSYLMRFDDQTPVPVRRIR